MSISNKLVLAISLGLLIISFTQDCYCTEGRCAESLAIFFSGALGFFMSWAGLSWLANPFLVTSWIAFSKNPGSSLITSLLASLLALSFLFFKEIMDNEGGYASSIISYKLGYWLWLSSCLTMLIGNVIRYFSSPAVARLQPSDDYN